MSRLLDAAARAARIVLLGLIVAAPVLAHKPSESVLSLDANAFGVDGRWSIALRDLDLALALDADADGRITWGELRGRRVEVERYVYSRVLLRRAGEDCTVSPRELMVERRSDGAYAQFRFAAACPSAGPAIALDYRLLFDLDARHRALVLLRDAGATAQAVMSAERPHQSLVAAASTLDVAGLYLGEGARHIWLGFDHLLFLLALLVGTVVRHPRTADPRSGLWVAEPRLRPVGLEVLKVVTAFTLAHSVTLSASAFGVVALPARLVESAIAGSIVVAATGTLRAARYATGWPVALGFGLIHGFGFAAALAELGLPQHGYLLSLLAFNAGVELGQLAVVGVFLPIAFGMRSTRVYQRGVMVAGSCAVAAIGLVWLAERALDLRLLGA